MEEIPQIEIYFDYIVAVIDLYTILCTDRNLEGQRTVRERIGGSYKGILYFC
jgi:hypothetical protein